MHKPRLIKLTEVASITLYSKPSIYRLMSQGKFPQSINLGGRSVFWLESDVLEFIQKCIDKSKEKVA